MSRPSSSNKILLFPTITRENIDQEFLSIEWQDIRCVSRFVVDDQGDVSSEETPWCKGLMRFLQ